MKGVSVYQPVVNGWAFNKQDGPSKQMGSQAYLNGIKLKENSLVFGLLIHEDMEMQCDATCCLGLDSYFGLLSILFLAEQYAHSLWDISSIALVTGPNDAATISCGLAFLGAVGWACHPEWTNHSTLPAWPQ